MEKEKIYCFGDSHVNFFSGINKIQWAWPKKSKSYLPFFKIFPLGPVLAYNLAENNTKTRGREKLFKFVKAIPPHSRILLSFGEIDCRAHLLKQSKIQKRDIKDLIAECVDRYFSVILELKKLGFEIYVWNVIPSTVLKKVQDKSYPVYGTCIQRNKTTILFNKILKRKCNINEIKFISFYNLLVHKNGTTNKEYFMDPIHLSQKLMPKVLKSFGFKDPFKVEIYRQKLAENKLYKDLSNSYSGLPQIKNKNTSGFWNRKFLKDRESYKNNQVYQDKIKIVGREINNNKGNYLDIGIGFAYLEEKIDKNNQIKIHGIDISKEVITFVKNHFKGDFKVGDILKIPYRRNTFNIITALDVIEHISPDKVFKAYSEIYRVLKKQGTLIVTIPLNEGLEFLFKTKKDTGGHVRVYTPELITAELKIAGFETKKIYYRSAFRNSYKLKSIANALTLNKLRKPNMLVIVAKKK